MARHTGSSARIRAIARKSGKRLSIKPLTDAHAEWLIGDRDEPGVTGWLRTLAARLRG